jgi:hypothetical protein
MVKRFSAPPCAVVGQLQDDEELAGPAPPRAVVGHLSDGEEIARTLLELAGGYFGLFNDCVIALVVC